MAEQNKPVDLHDVVKQMSKLNRLIDDMDRMLGYTLDMRNITILLAVLSIIGGLGFFIFKLLQLKFGNKWPEPFRGRPDNFYSNFPPPSSYLYTPITGDIGGGDDGKNGLMQQKASKIEESGSGAVITA